MYMYTVYICTNVQNGEHTLVRACELKYFSPSASQNLLIDFLERLLAVVPKALENIRPYLTQVCPSDARRAQSDVPSILVVETFPAPEHRPVNYLFHFDSHRSPKPISEPRFHLA